FDSSGARAREALGRPIDSRHRDQLQHLAAQKLHHQVGADIARPDDCASDARRRFSVGFHRTNLPLTAPRWSNRATIESPAATSTARHKAPGMIMLPAARIWPNSASLLASHATGSAGCPRTAAPTPFSTTAPFFSSVMPTFARSYAFGRDFCAPSTTRAEDA